MLPVVDITKSSLLNGQTNGKLSPNILRTVNGQAGGADVTLVVPASRAWVALCAAAKSAGHILKATSTADSYRTYEQQKTIFLARYRLQYKANTDTKWWEGQRWYKWYGAIAAAPGTSNHGWASAVDTGEEEDSDPYAESLDSATLNWLIVNERRFGWSHELQSEPWHLRYFAGDSIPSAVLAYEQSQKPKPPPAPETPLPEDMTMLIKSPGGSICLLAGGKIVVVVDKSDGVQPEESAQLLQIQASLPTSMRTPVPTFGWFFNRLKKAYGEPIR